MATQLTDQQVADYRERGYLVVPDVFDAARIQAMRDAADRLLEESRRVTEHTDVFDLEPDHSAEQPRLRRIKDPEKQDPAFDAALRDDHLLDMVSQLVGTAGIRYNGTKLNMKASGGGTAVEWHQDWGFYPHSNDDLLAVGVAMDDMTRDNGCLLMRPGSHHGPLYDHHQDGRFIGAINDPTFDDSGSAEVTMAAGDISIHHVRTAHASAPNVSGQSRRLLLLMYCSADSMPLVPIFGHGSLEEFASTFVRGEAGPEIRCEVAPIRIPWPTPLADGSIFETQSKLKGASLAAAAAGAGAGTAAPE